MTLAMPRRIQTIRGWFRSHRSRTAAAGMAGLAVASGLAGTATPGAAMSGYQWKNRPLVVFAPVNQSVNLVRQRRIINANRAGFQNRDMVVITVVGDRVTSRFGRNPRLGAEGLRQRFGSRPRSIPGAAGWQGWRGEALGLERDRGRAVIRADQFHADATPGNAAAGPVIYQAGRQPRRTAR